MSRDPAAPPPPARDGGLQSLLAWAESEREYWSTRNADCCRTMDRVAIQIHAALASVPELPARDGLREALSRFSWGGRGECWCDAAQQVGTHGERCRFARAVLAAGGAGEDLPPLPESTPE